MNLPLAAGFPCLLFAVRRESMFFWRQIPAPRSVRDGPCAAFRCGEQFLVLETGVGQTAVESALGWVLAGPAAPGFVVLAGFAGGLQPEMRIGDVIAADAIIDETGGHWSATWPPGTIA